MQLCDDKELDECINKGREIEDKLKKSRRQKLALKKEFKKKVKEDEEMLAVKRKYYDSRKALYDERSEHIKSIPHFWKTAFLGFKNLRKHLSDGDEKIIEFLESVVVDDGHNQKSITFFFKKNQYFENLFLKKIYSHTHKGIVNESGTKILWKKGTGTTIGSETEDPALMDIASLHGSLILKTKIFQKSLVMRCLRQSKSIYGHPLLYIFEWGAKRCHRRKRVI
ncbi:NAP1-related protein 1-like isoform X3 [Papaver somniferum]|uniref:NAP1-related protein 1-like isoform X3 n=1 Tax=Papaver somniferum TaxID=3469 RepID=UPI000E6F607C|nr:NAP1-related protein 1-like isoform X3 [Papaver somniferum]